MLTVLRPLSTAPPPACKAPPLKTGPLLSRRLAARRRRLLLLLGPVVVAEGRLHPRHRRVVDAPPRQEGQQAGAACRGAREGEEDRVLRESAADVLRVAEAQVEGEAAAPRDGRAELEAVVDAVPADCRVDTKVQRLPRAHQHRGDRQAARVCAEARQQRRKRVNHRVGRRGVRSRCVRRPQQQGELLAELEGEDERLEHADRVHAEEAERRPLARGGKFGGVEPHERVDDVGARDAQRGEDEGRRGRHRQRGGGKVAARPHGGEPQ
mmetsp:Transcript_40938/g.135603  ORF Transcript_40938/g.135603 Transcript_40938/m.135603 type:complete len:267 (-) Transcript_40938:125-925(-)